MKRWRRFGIKTILLLVLLLSLATFWVADQRRKSVACVQALHQIKRVAEQQGFGVRTVHESRYLTDQLFSFIHGRKCTGLIIWRVSAQGNLEFPPETLKSLHGIEELSLYQSLLKRKQLEQLPDVESIWVGEADTGDLQEYQGFRELEQLRIRLRPTHANFSRKDRATRKLREALPDTTIEVTCEKTSFALLTYPLEAF